MKPTEADSAEGRGTLPAAARTMDSTSIDPAITGELSEEHLGGLALTRQVEPSGAGPSQPQ